MKTLRMFLLMFGLIFAMPLAGFLMMLVKLVERDIVGFVAGAAK